MDELERAAELIDRLGFARYCGGTASGIARGVCLRCDRLRLLMDEVETAMERTLHDRPSA
jgi:hypothetical protein